MIEIEKAESYRSCNVCHSIESVCNFTFWAEGTNSGTQISLCKKCAEVLINKIEVVFNLK